MMTLSRLRFLAALTALALGFLLGPRPAAAQNGKQIIGEVFKPTRAQAGAGDTSYDVLRLNPGDRVTVVAIKFDRWLQIVPPEGSYCLVPAGHVTRNGAAGFPTEGVASRDLNVRIASQINEMKWDFAPRRIPAGSRLTILGETDDQYYMIPPPSDVYYYVPKDALRPVTDGGSPDNGDLAAQPPVDGGAAVADGTETPDATDVPMPDDAGELAARPDDTTPDVNGEVELPDSGERTPIPGDEATPESATTRESMTDASPTTAPVLSSDEAAVAFLTLEEQYAAEVSKPIDQQQLDELEANYQRMIDEGELGTADAETAQVRLKGIERRRKAIEQFEEVRRMQEQMRAAEQEMADSSAQYNQQIEQATVKRYAAVGVLRTSKLRLGRQTLYRLTDPNTGRTLVYVRADAGEMAAAMTANLGQFVGIEGSMVDDPRVKLSYLNPAAVETVDPAALYQSVTADMIPPTMVRAE